ncbi:hypothetical protein ACFP3U_12480 [Kitasatospora misakiensis]|uniref:Uncharacterized protein n=1 Tax=Kitasatospora misakiensis TaxID=67330 RepID=A0ABW0X1V1_9ACTN
MAAARRGAGAGRVAEHREHHALRHRRERRDREGVEPLERERLVTGEQPVPAEAEQHGVLEDQQRLLEPRGQFEPAHRDQRGADQDDQADQGALDGRVGVQPQARDAAYVRLVEELDDRGAGDRGLRRRCRGITALVVGGDVGVG